MPALLRALRRRDVLAGFWLFSLPAVFAGVLEVLVPLRLDDLGASGVAIGAIFLVAAALRGADQPPGRPRCRTATAGSRRSGSAWPGRW